MSSTRARARDTASGSPSEGLVALVEELKKKLESQEQTIAQLQASSAGQGRSSSASGSASARPPSIPFYSGEGESCTTSKVQSFLYNVRKAGAFSNYDENRMLALAECYFTDSAAKWLEKLEEEDMRPSTISELREAMIKEFVPPDEVSKAKIELMDFKMKGSMDSHVKKFKSLIEVTETPLKEAYVYFFMSLPAQYKEEFHKKFPSGEPGSGVSMSEVYKHARVLATAKHWNVDENKTHVTKTRQADGKFKDKEVGSHCPSKWDSKKKEKTNKTGKDDSLESWGPVQFGEKFLYIKAGRCMVCGKKGWNDPDHPCRKKREAKKTPNQSKN